MICLLNNERVVWEIMELTRHHIAEVLHVDPTDVTAQVDLEGGKLVPEFGVDAEAAAGVSEEEIREVMGNVYSDCKKELVVRLQGLKTTRDSVLRVLRGEEKTEEETGDAAN